MATTFHVAWILTGGGLKIIIFCDLKFDVLCFFKEKENIRGKSQHTVYVTFILPNNTVKTDLISVCLFKCNNVLCLWPYLNRSRHAAGGKRASVCSSCFLFVEWDRPNISTNESTGFYKQALWLVRGVRRRDLSTQVTVEASTYICQAAKIRTKKKKLKLIKPPK